MTRSLLSPAAKVLMVAFHFPPLKGSSGLERTLGFCRHLPAHGWNPIVLTANPRVYPTVSDERLSDIPGSTHVERAFALDTARDLSLRGRYPRWAALPDRWVSWIAAAVPSGMALIGKHRPQAIWSTYPIGTAHIIGWALHRLTALPWIADFRDPMVEFDRRTHAASPKDRALRNARLWVERLCASRASRIVFCTNGAREIFANRYPLISSDRTAIIANGFDEDAFLDAATLASADRGQVPGMVTLLHSGLLYPGPDRDPRAFFEGLKRFIDTHPRSREKLRVVLRATGFDDRYAQVINDLGLHDAVVLAPPLPYRDALAEMLSADGLLVFQGYTSNPAIPAKLYEYFRARRPILAMLDFDGDTAGLLKTEGVGKIVPIENPEAIASGLAEFVSSIEDGSANVISEERAATFERRHRAAELASILDDCVSRAR